MIKRQSLRRRIELLKLKKIACCYLAEYQKSYYRNGANIENVVHIQDPALEYDPVKNRSVRNYHDLVTYQNGYYYFAAGSHTVTYMPSISIYQKK